MTLHKPAQEVITSLLKSKFRTLVLYLDCPKCMATTDGMAHIHPADPGFSGDLEIDPEQCKECQHKFTDDDIADAIEQSRDLFN